MVPRAAYNTFNRPSAAVAEVAPTETTETPTVIPAPSLPSRNCHFPKHPAPRQVMVPGSLVERASLLGGVSDPQHLPARLRWRFRCRG